MSDFIGIVRKCNCHELHSPVGSLNPKYLSYTRLMEDRNTWTIAVTDVTDVWTIEIGPDELDAMKDQAHIQTNPAFLNKFREGMTSRDVQVTEFGEKATLNVGKGSNTLTFDLYKISASEKNKELCYILFHLTQRITSLQSALTEAESKVSSLEQQKRSGGVVMDLQGATKKGATSAQPKQIGMSIVNPTSKKRKVAKGVNFN